MSTTVTTEDLNPTTSINSLPLEIKILIVNLASLQDESYKARQESENQEESELSKGVLEENRWRGKSLNALFEVNKEWSDLAATHIFEKITSKHDIVSPIFKFVVLPRRASLLQSVDLAGENLADRLSAFLLSPMIRCIDLTGKAVDALFGDLVNPGISGTIEQNLHWSVFFDRGRSITKLYMVQSTLVHVNCILRALPALMEIDLKLRMRDEQEENKLGVLLAQYSSLKKLSLKFNADSIPASWIDLEWKSESSLQSLSLTASNQFDVHFNQTDLDFISMFNSTLEQLTVRNYTISSTPVPSTTFPKLTFLVIDTDSLDLQHLLQMFSASPIISLRYETMNKMDEADRVSIDKTLAKYISGHPFLQKLEICHRFLLSEVLLPEVKNISKVRQLIVKHSTWDNQVLDDPDPDWILSDQEHFDYRRPILKKVFNHGNNLLGRLEKENNVEGLKEMFDNCKWLRASLAESED